MVSQADGDFLAQFRVDPGAYREKLRERLVETEFSQAAKAAKTRRLRGSFVPVVPLDSLYQWESVGPGCLAIMMLLHRWSHMKRMGWPVTIGEDTLLCMDMSVWRRDAALDRLAAAGLIRVERRRGRSPRIWLVEPPDGLPPDPP